MLGDKCPTFGLDLTTRPTVSRRQKMTNGRLMTATGHDLCDVCDAQFGRVRLSRRHSKHGNRTGAT